MKEEFRGGCFCGAVRFEATEIFDAGYCHCSICRRFAGAPLVVWANTPARAFRITAGHPTGFASSDHWVRYFCPTCGGPVFGRHPSPPADGSDLVCFCTTSLDHPEAIRPTAHIWCSSRLSYFDTTDELPRFADGQLTHPSKRGTAFWCESDAARLTPSQSTIPVSSADLEGRPNFPMGQGEGSERILSRMVAWATTRDDLRGIAVVGSRARSDHPADAWSDLDVLVMARRPRRYLTQPDWLAAIETPWLAVKEPTPIGGQEILLVTFAGGTKVDISVVPSRAFALAARALGILRRYPAAASVAPRVARERLVALSDVLNRGLRVVLDKDGMARHLESGGLPMPAPAPPSQDEFLDLVSRFLNEQVWIALKMRREELFLAKTLGESRLSALLLRMIEWHARATSGRWSSVYEHGRFLEEWAAPKVVGRLREVFPRYDAAEIWSARLAALDFFRQLAEETGARLGYTYPHELEDKVMNWVRTVAEEYRGNSSTPTTSPLV